MPTNPSEIELKQAIEDFLANPDMACLRLKRRVKDNDFELIIQADEEVGQRVFGTSAKLFDLALNMYPHDQEELYTVAVGFMAMVCNHLSIDTNAVPQDLEDFLDPDGDGDEDDNDNNER